VDATACDGRRVPGAHLFGGFPGWLGEAGLLGGSGRSFGGGAPWPGGFTGCPGLGLPCLGSDTNNLRGTAGERDPGGARNEGSGGPMFRGCRENLGQSLMHVKPAAPRRALS